MEGTLRLLALFTSESDVSLRKRSYRHPSGELGNFEGESNPVTKTMEMKLKVVGINFSR